MLYNLSTAKSFEWDELKNAINIQKHGVDFEEAQQVFLDSEHLIFEDLAHSSVESRYFCIGEVDGVVLTVRFTYRGEAIRIIGAGYWRKGKKLYEKKRRLY